MKIELDHVEALRILEILHDLHKMTMDDLADPKVVGALQAKAFVSSLDVRASLHEAAYAGIEVTKMKGSWVKGTEEDDEDYEYIPSAEELS